MFSKSWDLKSGEMVDHPQLNEIVQNFAFTEVNGKIWRTGGHTENGAIRDTFYLNSNFTWSKGLELPTVKESHSMITITQHEVLIIGGNLQGYSQETANHIWVYNDDSQTYTTMADFELGTKPSAAKTYIPDIKKEAILVLIKNRVYFYDLPYDSWIEADPTWIHPVPNFERIKLFTSNNRYNIVYKIHAYNVDVSI